MRVLFLPILVSLSGCPAPAAWIPSGDPVPLRPVDGPVPGWVVQVAAAPELPCPDGRPARLWVARPEEVPDDAPIAVVFHAGAFDWVSGSSPDAPLAGAHHATPSRLDADWAAREAHAVLGMWASAEATIDARGALAVALAEAGVVQILPANCWGDLWHNAGPPVEGRVNDTFRDGFTRQGHALALAAWALATDPAAAIGDVPLPATGPRFLIGQSTGGRGVTELLHAGAEPDGVALDGTPDDLGAYLSGDPLLYAGVADGLPRLFPDGLDAIDDGALWTAPLPPRVAYLWSSRDPTAPAAAHAPALERLAAVPGATTLDTGLLGHVGSAGSAEVAALLVDALRDPPAESARSARVDAHPIGQ